MQKFQRIIAIVLLAAAFVVAAIQVLPAPASAETSDIIEVIMETTPVIKHYRVEEGDTKGEKEPIPEPESKQEPELTPEPGLIDEEARVALVAIIHGEAAGRNDEAEKQLVVYNSLIRMGVEPERAYLMVYVFTEEIRNMMAQTIYGEANYSWLTPAQKSMVIWAILNRYDSGEGWFSDNYYDLYHIIAKPGQFDGYDPSFPIIEEYRELVDDIINRYIDEKLGATDVGRTLPNDICFFSADEAGRYNVFYKMSIPWLSGEKIYFGIEPLCDPYAEVTA